MTEQKIAEVLMQSLYRERCEVFDADDDGRRVHVEGVINIRRIAEALADAMPQPVEEEAP